MGVETTEAAYMGLAMMGIKINNVENRWGNKHGDKNGGGTVRWDMANSGNRVALRVNITEKQNKHGGSIDGIKK